MALTAVAASTEDLSPRANTTPADTTSFEERWTAWQERGAAHDRAVRRRMRLAVPILAIVAAVLYVLLMR